MSGRTWPLISLCALFATVCSGCVFIHDDCDYVETRCWDVADVYCDRWGCWESVWTECEDFCVDASSPRSQIECTDNRHCASGYVCEVNTCVRTGADGSGARLCEACEYSADCEEQGALCLNLLSGAESGYCGRVCTDDAGCPDNYECLTLAGVTSRQCAPTTRMCVAGLPAECAEDTDCGENGECTEGACISVECTEHAQCGGDEVCLDGACAPAECATNGECAALEACVAGVCESVADVICDRSADCGNGVCIDQGCFATCETTGDCPSPMACEGGLCIAQPAAACQTGSDCGDGDHHCVDGMCREACGDGGVCSFGYFCRGFYCDVDPAVACRTSEECSGDLICVAGDCS